MHTFADLLLMKCKADIEKLAEIKINASHCLVNNAFYDDAYYLSGYAIELCLKARICKILGVDDFFNFDKKVAKELYRPYKNHDYTELILLSGLHSEFENLLGDPDFKVKWSILNKWNEKARYEDGRNPSEVKEFVTLAKQFCEWIQKHL